MEWYQQTTRRDESGRYIVRLPFKQNADPEKTVCNSQQKAYIRFSQLEKRLNNDDDLRNQYVAFMEEYLALGHMVEGPVADKFTKQTYYLPHHAVRKDDSTTTKLRVVFNASQATPTGKSLNDILLVGPNIQNSITHVLMRWRTHRYVIAADIEKMYRQISIHPQDQDYQRILWRSHPSEPIKHFKLTTVTYGTASAPYLAMRTLHQLSDDERMHYPKACRAIKEDFYVDDVLTGGDTIKEAQTLQQDLIKVLQKGGFKLRKWAANHDSLLESIPVSDREANPPLSIDKEDHIKTLGLRWHPARDCFFFKVTLEEITGTVLTKRQLLSEVAKLFDPMGWLQPCIVVGKIMMQQLWLQHRTWDEPITEELDAKWRNFRSQLPVLQEITIPRWLHCSDIVTIQVHGFCDASEAAYAAVIYARVEERDGSTTVQLITSKSKVAPLKVQSIPRLELCSAALLCDLMSTTLEAHGWKHVIPYYWTDSMIVLQWLQSPAAKWKVFIANRVSHIHSSSDSKQWRHINSKANPADVASRGIFPNFLKNHVQWWNGPDWLKEHQDKWPKSRFICNKAVTNLEVRQKAACFTTIKAEEKENSTQRFSSFTKLTKLIQTRSCGLVEGYSRVLQISIQNTLYFYPEDIWLIW
ncbi:uncharacterized protein LOC119656896 [Hermetia illucens]|uniref:uncharacterized protein LOC119656896 n=1 Tax=Hermetia illucens TaxID=343691 RepID=UPI0018CC1DDF|nr:uncharacterized protein LOC119656896 [Hermetia illucens]